MKKKVEKTVILLLCAAMVFSLAACGSSSTGESGTESSSGTSSDRTTYVRTGDYDTDSAAIYDAALGEFYEYYQVAKEETNLSMRYALMAIAEAKLLEASVYLPTIDNGGYYALRRYAPYGAATVTWGTNMYRYENMVATEEVVTAEDYNYRKR